MSVAGPRTVAWLGLALAVGAVTFLGRLVPVLRGGRLEGLGNYDDGVYFGASTGFVHGLLPYRDFLLLHPPGIVLALAPFAALGRLVGDPAALATGRVAWMLLGAVNAVLVARILRRQGLLAAGVGGLFYALYWPAVYSDRTTELETLGTTLTLTALLLLARERGRTWRWPALAGACLGAAAGVKIWAALAVVVVVVAVALTDRLGAGLAVLLGAGVGAAVVCGPFFVAAPGAMWRMVVLDQLGRPRSGVSLGSRLDALIGQGAHPFSAISPLTLGTGALLLMVAAAAVRVRDVRLTLVVGASSAVLLALTPSWFPHYASLVAGPASVAVGAGAGWLVGRAAGWRRTAGWITAGAGLLVVACYGAPLASARLGTAFPGTALRPAATAVSGCVTSDDPTTLIELDVLSRDLDRGCALVVDLGGWTYDHPPVPPVSRPAYGAFQQYCLDYLRAGDATISIRFTDGSGFSAGTARTVQAWPVLARSGSYALRRPTPGR